MGTAEQKSCGKTASCNACDDTGGRKIQSRLARISHKIVVLSGKGGVGKSTVAVNLAVALTVAGKRVGLLDVDMHGPSIPTMLALEGEILSARAGELIPVSAWGMQVVSIGFILRGPDEAVIWRGPMKMGVIKQFLGDVCWGDLDYLIIDSPPGTGDEPLSVCQLIGSLDGALIVTTPQKVAAVDVRKSITFCRELKVPVLGVVENMSGFICPHCGKKTDLFNPGGGEKMAREMNVPFLGQLPFDPGVGRSCDDGMPFAGGCARTETARIFKGIIEPIIKQTEVK